MTLVVRASGLSERWTNAFRSRCSATGGSGCRFRRQRGLTARLRFTWVTRWRPISSTSSQTRSAKVDRIPSSVHITFFERGIRRSPSRSSSSTTGYELLRGGKVDAAVAIFRLNADAFPKSANVYDGMGEAYMNHGDRALAIENYERSLALNPANDDAPRAGREASRRCHPIIDRQSRHARELVSVVCDECCVQASRMGGDEEIIWPNGCPAARQCVPYVTVVPGSIALERQHLERREKSVECRSVTLGVLAPGDAVFKLRDRDSRHAYRRSLCRVLRQSAHDRNRAPRDRVNANVGVEENHVADLQAIDDAYESIISPRPAAGAPAVRPVRARHRSRA